MHFCNLSFLHPVTFSPRCLRRASRGIVVIRGDISVMVGYAAVWLAGDTTLRNAYTQRTLRGTRQCAINQIHAVLAPRYFDVFLLVILHSD